MSRKKWVIKFFFWHAHKHQNLLQVDTLILGGFGLKKARTNNINKWNLVNGLDHRYIDIHVPDDCMFLFKMCDYVEIKHQKC